MKHRLAACLFALTAGATHADTTLTYMMWGDPPEIAVWEQLVANFHAANPDITVKVEVSDWDSYWNKLRVQTAGGDAPDVFAMDGPIYPDWQSRGALLNLQPFLDTDPAALEGVYDAPLSVYKLPDGYSGLPRDFQTIMMYYNKAMFDAAGVAPPDESWTIDDFRTAAKALTLDTDGDGKTDQWGVSTEVWDMEPFWGPMVYNHGGDIISADHTHTLMTEGPARDAFAFINAMMTEDKSIMSAEELESYGYDGFSAGVAAMTFSGHWVIPKYNDLAFDWAVAPFPKGPAGRATLVNSAGIVIGAGTAHPDEAWKFVRYVISPEGQSVLASLGFAIPVTASVATGPAYLEQTSKGDHKLFVDALEYARPKPSFRGYEEWAGLVGDPLGLVWTGESDLGDALDEIAATADDVLGK
jgi:multiple sugar transport system substrate-binding protein